MPVREVDDQRAHPPRMQAEPQDVHRRLEQGWVDVGPGRGLRHRRVRGDVVPGTVEDECGIGLVRGEDPVERLADRLELGVGERPLGKCRGVARGEQEMVAIPEGDLQLLGDRKQHLAAGL